MLISHAKEFVLWRPPKTASTTAEYVLRQHGNFDEAELIAAHGFGRIPTANIPQKLIDEAAHNINERFRLMRKQDKDMSFFPETLRGQEGFTVPNIAHMTPSEAIAEGFITIEQLREYKCFAFLRNPRDRYVSSIHHALGSHLITPGMLENQLVNGTVKKLGMLGRNQTDYFFVDGEQVTEALDFRNYVSEIHRMLTLVEGHHPPFIPRINPSKKRDKDISVDEWFIGGANAKLAEIYRKDIAFYEKSSAVWATKVASPL